MRVIPGVLGGLLLAGCASQPPANPVTACSEPRPQVCTMEYAPVCANLVAGGTKQFASACNACADDSVAGYVQGECRE